MACRKVSHQVRWFFRSNLHLDFQTKLFKKKSFPSIIYIYNYNHNSYSIHFHSINPTTSTMVIPMISLSPSHRITLRPCPRLMRRLKDLSAKVQTSSASLSQEVPSAEKWRCWIQKCCYPWGKGTKRCRKPMKTNDFPRKIVYIY